MQPFPIPSSTIEDAVEKSIGRRSRSMRNLELGMIVPEVRIFRASLITDYHGGERMPRWWGSNPDIFFWYRRGEDGYIRGRAK